jgi:hypothetical protein
MKSITVKGLGLILYEEFHRDAWGTVDPFYFKDPPGLDDIDTDMRGLREVLQRVVERLNKEK